ncbi:hypothetical protein CN093_03965 [Sinorhizobium meliloti]|uniref:hypothetical protein n=1 Tax=Rhizobium meliloti TaxID=382 RepID=UPI000FD54C55|nr:hypothetical protein [Sinorhizobium meliloti]RVO43472.1 hypothetical protein CN093_03965 [Sinorhizobium meliloti]
MFSSALRTALFAMFTTVNAFAAQPQSCGSEYWPGTLPEHQVDSVEVADIQQFLDTSPVFDGIEFAATVRNDELWLDIVRYPGDVTMLASIRTLLVIGRVVKPQYKKVVLADNGTGLFEISYNDLHAIGCQFVWGVQGKGQNPVALNRDLADRLRFYPDGGRVAPPYNGSLMGDTNAMLTTMNKIVYPQWMMKTVKIK